MSGHCELCGETGGHSAACVSNPYQAANQRVIIATLTADLARLTAELERKQRECEGLREAAAVMLPLARRMLWTAYVWNDHNFDHPIEYARETAQKYDIYSFDEADQFLSKCEAALSAGGSDGNA